MKRTPPHELKYTLHALALILGVGRERLARALSEAGTDTTEPLTVAAAFAALAGRLDDGAIRRRKLEAEADHAELNLKHRLGELMFTKDAKMLWDDLIIRLRQLVQSRTTWNSSQLLVAMSKVRLEERK